MRRKDIWFEITYKENDIFKTQHHLAKDKDVAERWGENKFGKIYGVQKVNRDDLLKNKEHQYNKIIQNQKPLGLQIARNVYEVDFDLTEMLLGQPKKKQEKVKEEKKSKWDLIAEREMS